MTHDKFAVLDQKQLLLVWFSRLAKAVHERWRAPAATRSGINGSLTSSDPSARKGTGVRREIPISSFDDRFPAPTAFLLTCPRDRQIVPQTN
jgi:hypothetical protein